MKMKKKKQLAYTLKCVVVAMRTRERKSKIRKLPSVVWCHATACHVSLVNLQFLAQRISRCGNLCVIASQRHLNPSERVRSLLKKMSDTAEIEATRRSIFLQFLKRFFFSGETFPQISEKIDENSHPNAFARLRTLSTTEQKSPKCALTKNGNIPKLWMCLFGGKKLLMLIKIFLSYDEQIFRFSSTSSLLLFQIDAC